MIRQAVGRLDHLARPAMRDVDPGTSRFSARFEPLEARARVAA